MTDAGDALHYISRWLHGTGDVRCSSACGRFAAGDLHGDTLVVDAQRRCHAVIENVGARSFELREDGATRQWLLVAEGEDSRWQAFPTMADLRWFALTGPSLGDGDGEVRWQPWPDPRGVGVPPVREHVRTSWTVCRPASEGDAPDEISLLGRLFVLVVMGLLLMSGRAMVLAALAGGWAWLWWPPALLMLLVGGAGALTVVLVPLLRKSATPGWKIVLDGIESRAADAWNIDTGVECELRARVRLESGERADLEALKCYASLYVEHLREGTGDEPVLERTWSGRARATLQASEDGTGWSCAWRCLLTPSRSSSGWLGTGRWVLEWDFDGSEGPLAVVELPQAGGVVPQLPLHCPPGRQAQLDALLSGQQETLVIESYHGKVDFGLLRHGGCPDIERDFTPQERRAVFTVSFEELVGHALQSGWLERKLARDAAGGGDDLRVFRSEGGYVVLEIDQGRSGGVLLESADPHAVVQACLRHRGILRYLRDIDGRHPVVGAASP